MSPNPARTHPPVLIGRDEQAATLQHAIERASAGNPQFILLEGEAGSGKTYLLHALLDRGNHTLYWGDTNEFAKTEFGPVRDMLRRARRDAPARFAAVREQHPILDLMLPEAGGEALAPPGREALFERTAQAFLAMSDGNVAVFVFDDMHASDHATVELLSRLRILARDETLLLIVAHRSDDLPRSHPLRRLRQQWRRSGEAIELQLDALDEPDSLALATARLGAEPNASLAADLLRLGGGLPLYVVELAEALVHRGALQRTAEGLASAGPDDMGVPQSLRETVLLRMAALEPETRRALERISVMGPDVDLDLLRAVGTGDGAVERLIESGWLCDAAPGEARFRHALLREAVYAQIPWTRRRRWHLECAVAMEADGRICSSAAEHWLAAREHERARSAMLARARRAAAIHAHADALDAVGRALELWPDGVDEAGRLEALYLLGDCAQRARQTDEAARAWNELCERAERAEAWRDLATARRRLAVLWAMGGEVERSVDERRAAAAAFLQAGLTRAAAVELCSAGDALAMVSQWRALLDVLQEAWPLAVAAGDLELQVLLQSQRGRALGRMGCFEEGFAEIHAALDVAEANGLASVVGHAHQRLADCHEHHGDYVRARALFFSAAERCDGHGDAALREACRACALPVLVQTGEWTLGLVLADEIVADPASPPWARVMGVSVGGQLLALRGEFRSARSRLREALRAVRAIGFRIAEPPTLHLLAVCDWFERKPLVALESARAALKIWAMGEEVHHIVGTASGLCALFAAAGDRQGVGACVDALSMAAQQTGQPEALAGLAYTMGYSQLLAEAPPEAVREFSVALELGKNLDLPFARAAALRGLAEAEGRLELPQAREHLREAIRLFASLGANPFVLEATLRLRRLAPLALTAAEKRQENLGLTTRQLQILSEVSRGRSSKEIARTLGLSPRTVEMHIARLMATLRCRTRAEAVARVSELKLPNPSG